MKKKICAAHWKACSKFSQTSLDHSSIKQSLQFHKLSTQDGENTEEWTGRLQISAIECKLSGTRQTTKRAISYTV